MFKKIMLVVVAIIGISSAAVAIDKYTRDVKVLPKTAQTTLENNFKAKVNTIKIDKELGIISDYDVVLTDGTEITFDRSGNWKDIETTVHGAVPAALVPDAITKYVNTAQPGQRIIGIDKERSGYDVELSNGVEMKFDIQGKFLRFDD